MAQVRCVFGMLLFYLSFLVFLVPCPVDRSNRQEICLFFNHSIVIIRPLLCGFAFWYEHEYGIIYLSCFEGVCLGSHAREKLQAPQLNTKAVVGIMLMVRAIFHRWGRIGGLAAFFLLRIVCILL